MSWTGRVGARIQLFTDPLKPPESFTDTCSNLATGALFHLSATYNFPQGRVTDHRIGLTVYKLEQVLAGELELLVDPLQQEHRSRQLAQSGEN